MRSLILLGMYKTTMNKSYFRHHRATCRRLHCTINWIRHLLRTFSKAASSLILMNKWSLAKIQALSQSMVNTSCQICTKIFSLITTATIILISISYLQCNKTILQLKEWTRQICNNTVELHSMCSSPDLMKRILDELWDFNFVLHKILDIPFPILSQKKIYAVKDEMCASGCLFEFQSDFQIILAQSTKQVSSSTKSQRISLRWPTFYHTIKSNSGRAYYARL